jgi:hypothetical protein
MKDDWYFRQLDQVFERKMIERDIAREKLRKWYMQHRADLSEDQATWLEEDLQRIRDAREGFPDEEG